MSGEENLYSLIQPFLRGNRQEQISSAKTISAGLEEDRDLFEIMVHIARGRKIRLKDNIVIRSILRGEMPKLDDQVAALHSIAYSVTVPGRKISVDLRERCQFFEKILPADTEIRKIKVGEITEDTSQDIYPPARQGIVTVPVYNTWREYYVKLNGGIIKGDLDRLLGKEKFCYEAIDLDLAARQGYEPEPSPPPKKYSFEEARLIVPRLKPGEILEALYHFRQVLERARK